MDLKGIIAQAVEAVKGIDDSDLRKIAFDRILEHLLGSKPAAERRTERTAALNTEPKDKLGKPGPTQWVKELVDEGYFAEPQSLSQLQQVLSERGHVLRLGDLTYPVEEFTKRRILRRQKLSPPEGGKPVWFYSNW